MYIYSQGRQATAHLVTTICLALLWTFAVTAWIAWFFLQEFWSLVDWLWPLPLQEILCSELPSLDCAIGLLSMRQHKQQSNKLGNLCHTTKISRSVCVCGFLVGNDFVLLEEESGIVLELFALRVRDRRGDWWSHWGECIWKEAGQIVRLAPIVTQANSPTIPWTTTKTTCT